MRSLQRKITVFGHDIQGVNFIRDERVLEQAEIPFDTKNFANMPLQDFEGHRTIITKVLRYLNTKLEYRFDDLGRRSLTLRYDSSGQS